MALFKGFLLVGLASFLQAHSLPETLEPTGYINLQFTMNTTSTQYSGIDLRNPQSVVNVQSQFYSSQPPKLSEATDAVAFKAGNLPAAPPVAPFQSKVDGSALRLIIFQNVTESVTIGPKPSVAMIYFQNLQMWSRQ